MAISLRDAQSISRIILGKCGIFARRAMIDQAREGLRYQRINLTFFICLT